MKSIKKILPFLVKSYKWILSAIPFIALVIFYIYSRQSFLTSGMDIYFQTIFLGIIAFNIPFLWNAYQKILEIKDNSRGDTINPILNRAFYSGAKTYFDAFLLYPNGMFTVFGLILSPLSPILLNIVWISLAVAFSMWQPDIFNWILKKHEKKLQDYLFDANPIDIDTRLIYKELWNTSESVMKKDLKVNVHDLLDILVNTVNTLLASGGANELTQTETLFMDISKSFQNLNIVEILYSGFFTSIFSWHFLMWQKSNSSDRIAPSSDIKKLYRSLLTKADWLLFEIFKRIFSEKSFDGSYFFTKFAEHVNQHADDKIPLGENELFYIPGLLTHFYEIFFEKISDYEDRYAVWQFYFPKDWKITKTTLSEQPRIVSITLEEFIKFAWKRIQHAEKGNPDLSLDDISEELFPDVDVMKWADILQFISLPFSAEEKRVKEVIETPRIFGFSSRIRSFSGYVENDKDFQKKASESMGAQMASERRETTHLLAYLIEKFPRSIFNQCFNGEKIKSYIAQLGKLSGKYTDNPLENRRKEFLEIFIDLQKTLHKPGDFDGGIGDES